MATYVFIIIKLKTHKNKKLKKHTKIHVNKKLKNTKTNKNKKLKTQKYM